MKKIASLKFLLLSVCLIVFTSGNIYSQSAREKRKMEEAAKLKTALDSMNFVFRAESVLPLGTADIASDGYQVIITATQVDSYLPYFGAEHTVNYDKSAATPLEFTSTGFSYSITPRKKGGWDITIATKDVAEPKTLLFTVFENGVTTLHANSNNRHALTFTGYVMPGKGKKK